MLRSLVEVIFVYLDTNVGQVSRPPIPLIIWLEFLGVMKKLGFTREAHGEEAAFPGGDPVDRAVQCRCSKETAVLQT